MDKPFGKLIHSDIFTFHIGPEKAPFAVHSVAIARQSPALDALVNSNMTEARSRTVTWPDVDVDTFIRFCEFCYLNDYSPPSCQQANGERSEEIPGADRWSEPSDAPPKSHPDKYGIEPLKDLVLYKLYRTLKNFTIFPTRIRDIIELIRFTYHDENTRGRVDGIDGLRKLVTHFVVYWLDCITWHDDFLEILYEGGEFVTDFWKLVRKEAVFPLREQE
ncbi:hypothetical protein TMEN_7144 [Trichophyton mentagrophytes]|nr:hypothetical protein TMEN_7144 [Trichophyton mentagrophytes]